MFTFQSYSQFGPNILVIVNLVPYYFHITVNLIHTINLLTKLPIWQTMYTVNIHRNDMANKIIVKKIYLTFLSVMLAFKLIKKAN